VIPSFSVVVGNNAGGGACLRTFYPRAQMQPDLTIIVILNLFQDNTETVVRYPETSSG
jgi:hypothetical protein